MRRSEKQIMHVNLTFVRLLVLTFGKLTSALLSD